MLTLYQFGPQWDCIDSSPFCSKLIAWLHLAGVDHQCRAGLGHIRRAPKGKMPYVEFPDGTVLADSNMIIRGLKQSADVTIDDALSVAQQAQAHAFGRMFDENTYWVVVYTRWIYANNYKNFTEPAFFAQFGALKRSVVKRVLQRKMRRAADAHGMGRHSEQEIFAIGQADLQAFADLLGDRNFAFGDRPTTLDASGFAFLDAILTPPHESPLKDWLRGQTRLVEYRNRMRETLG